MRTLHAALSRLQCWISDDTTDRSLGIPLPFRHGPWTLQVSLEHALAASLALELQPTLILPQVSMARSSTVDRYRFDGSWYLSRTPPQGATVPSDSKLYMFLRARRTAELHHSRKAHGIMATIITFLIVAVCSVSSLTLQDVLPS